MPKTSFGVRLQGARKAKGDKWSQQFLDTKIGKAPKQGTRGSYVAQLENGNIKKPTRVLCHKLEEVLDLERNDLWSLAAWLQLNEEATEELRRQIAGTREFKVSEAERSLLKSLRTLKATTGADWAQIFSDALKSDLLLADANTAGPFATLTSLLSRLHPLQFRGITQAFSVMTKELESIFRRETNNATRAGQLEALGEQRGEAARKALDTDPS